MLGKLMPKTVPAASITGPAADDQKTSGLKRKLRGTALGATIVIGSFFFALGGWASVFPLSSAAVAPGVVSPDGSRKTIQHLEGGIIREILVRDGDRVEAGQALVVLEDVQAKASHDVTFGRYVMLSAMLARLHAVQGDAAGVSYPAWLMELQGEPEVDNALETQTTVFHTRRKAVESRKAILRKQIDQLSAEIEGLEAEIDAADERLDLISQEIADVNQLVSRGLERRPRLLALQRQRAEIRGERASDQSAIARAEQAIGQAELEIIDLDVNQQDRVAEEQMSVSAEIASLEEQLRAAEDILRRTVITAPVTGTVVGLQYKTSGGVIGPGEPIMDVVPADDELLVDARVSPLDIDNVQIGQPARIRLSGLSQRNTAPIEGTVRTVSADSLTDRNSGESYFSARVEVPASELELLGEGVELSPGMPAEVMIVTGERTALNYLLDPFVASLERSFTEND